MSGLVVDAARIRDVEERAARAWPPFEQVDLGGWWLRFSQGASRRGNSVLALTDAPTDAIASYVNQVEQAYRDRGLIARFQVAPDIVCPAVKAELDRRGYAREGVTQMQVVNKIDAKLLAGGDDVQLKAMPDDGWRRVYGASADTAAEGALRCDLAAGMPKPSVYAHLTQAGETVASGAASILDGWALINCMATLRSHRRQGLASRVLGALVAWSMEQGCETLFLQVEDANTSAQALYAQAGFQPIYTYHYRTQRSEASQP